MGASVSSQKSKDMLQSVINLLVKQFNFTPTVAKKVLLFLKDSGITLDQKILGRGGSGVLLSGFQNSSHTPVAIKILSPKNNKEFNRNVEEFSILQKLKSPYIAKGLQLLETCIQKKTVQYFIMERCLSHSNVIKQIDDLDSQEKALLTHKKIYIYKIALDLIKGLIEIHQNQLIHLDIKPKNIVIGSDNNWKFIDMGISAELLPQKGYVESIKGFSFEFCSPEQFQLCKGLAQNKISQASDIYSLGLVFLQMTGTKLSIDQVKISKIQPFNFEELFNSDFEQFNNIIKQMIYYQPRERSKLMTIHSYMSQLYKQELSTTQNENAFQPKTAVSLDSMEDLTASSDESYPAENNMKQKSNQQLSQVNKKVERKINASKYFQQKNQQIKGECISPLNI